MCIGGGARMVGDPHEGLSGWVPTPHIGTGNPGTPEQSHSWAPGTSLEPGKMQVQTRSKVHSQARSGCGELKTESGAAPLGQGLIALRVEVGSWAMGRERQDCGCSWDPGNQNTHCPLTSLCPIDFAVFYYLLLQLWTSAFVEGGFFSSLWAVSPMEREEPSMSCHCHQHHKGSKISGCTELSQCCLKTE